MRKTIFCVLVILVVGIISSHVLMAVPQEEGDNYGKVIIQVVDVDTGEPVNEVFRVNFYNSLLEAGNDKSFERSAKTDNSGYLLVKHKPGIYYLQFQPESSNSKYEIEPSPVLSENNRQKISVEIGKVTEVLKKANYGGYLKIILVDSTGKKINPKEEFPEKLEDVGISAYLSGEGLFGFYIADSKSVSGLTNGIDDLNDGEVIVGRLYPGSYEISVFFGFLGIKKQEVKGIQLFRNQTTIQEVVIDANADTGIEGYVTDQNDAPLKYLEVEIQKATSKTDKNGYYKIVGIKEGRYIISVHSSLVADDDIFINKSFYIDIFKNKIIRKDFVMKIK